MRDFIDRYEMLLLWLMLCVVIALMMCGCKTKYMATPEYHFLDVGKMVYQHDSIFAHDSVYVTQYVVGDTVFRDKVRTQYMYRYVGKADTVLVTRRDSVPYPVKTVVTEYKWRTRWYDTLCRRFTVVVLACGVGALVAWIVRKRTK